MSAQPHIDDLTRARLGRDLPVEAVEHLMEALVVEHGAGHAAEMALAHLGTGGKRLRARLALAAARALGTDPTTAVPWASACELMHNASLVHDDLQDGDHVRRGQPALWSIYGADQAINAGDLMLMLPTLALGELDASDRIRWRLAELVARHGAQTARGQAEEMQLRSLQRLDEGSYLRAACGKTAGLFGMPVEGAALLSGRTPRAARRLARPFETLGLCYQLQDDVVDLYGEKGRGAPGADIREGKVSALVVAHLALHPGDRLWLCGILRSDRTETPDASVEEVMERFARGGALDAVLGHIRSLADEVEGAALDDAPTLRDVARALRARILGPLERLRV